MPLQPYWASTGKLFAPLGTQVLIGDFVSGPGIITGTVVVNITTVIGTTGVSYLEITLSLNPGPFSAGPSGSNNTPAGVSDYHQSSHTSLLTGNNVGYESSVTFSRLISTQNQELIHTPDQTLSFKEDVKGWVSFKSFFVDTGVSMAGNYYTTFNGRLFKHYEEHVNRNHFYGTDYNSSVNVVLNDGPGSVKSFHTLAYEGSKSRVNGIKEMEIQNQVLITDSSLTPDNNFAFFKIEDLNDILGTSDWNNTVFSIKHYSSVAYGKTLLQTIDVRAWDLTNSDSSQVMGWGYLEKVSGGMSFYHEEFITTQSQEDSVNHFNITPKDGWYVSGIETNKQEGSINEFIEKEGKWFNYIKGVDSDITSETDFGAFDIQGIGILSSISSGVLTFDNNINVSLQVGDIIYFQTPSINGMFNTIDSSNMTKHGDVTAKTNNTITVNLLGSAPVADDYIMFAKNHTVNTSSLLGYFADVKFENNSTGKIELFSVGSEITESSK